MEKLAIHGGPSVRATPMPNRKLFGAEEKEAAMRVFDDSVASGNAFLYNGKYEQEYEKAFGQFMGGGFTDGVNSGTNALFVALGALQLDAASEVVVPPITDAGGVMPVVLLNCIPVPADADPRTYNVGPEQVRAAITERTRAIVIAHIGGDVVDMDPILEIAHDRKIPVVEDCSQTHGGKYKGRLVGTLGDIAAFSTMGGKHHAAGGQGGLVYTHSEELFWQARRFADRGKPFNLTEAAGNVRAGLNCNLNDLAAAIGTVQIGKLPGIIARRRAVGETIKQRLDAEAQSVSVGWQTPESESVYWFLRIKIETEKLRVDKNTFVQALAAEGIGATASYRHLPSEAPWFVSRITYGKSACPWACPLYQGDRKRHDTLPNAIKATESHFNVVVYESYGEQETEDIVRALLKVERGYLK